MKLIISFLLLVSISLTKEVEITTDDGTLKGTLIESSKNEDIVVLIIAGSGPTDRDGNSALASGKNNSLKMLAENIEKLGYSSLRYDKRLIGESKGFPTEAETVFGDFIDDAVFCIEFLENSGYENIIIAGHSEGSLIGSIAAHRTDAAGFISLCGLARNFGETIIGQIAKGAPSLLPEAEKIVQSLSNGKKIVVVNQSLQQLFRVSSQDFLIDVMQYEPTEEIAKIEAPVLIINGENDFQIMPDEGKLLNTAAQNSKYVALDSMNHVLKNTSSDMQLNLQTYSNPNLPINSSLVELVKEYLEEIK